MGFNSQLDVTEVRSPEIVVYAAFQVHRTLGPGLLESVYEKILGYEINQRHLKVDVQVAVPVVYAGMTFEAGFRADMIVEQRVIVELKSVEKILPVHYKQLLTYLRLADKRLGLLINFGAPLIKDGIKRVVNKL